MCLAVGPAIVIAAVMIGVTYATGKIQSNAFQRAAKLQAADTDQALAVQRQRDTQQWAERQRDAQQWAALAVRRQQDAQQWAACTYQSACAQAIGFTAAHTSTTGAPGWPRA